MITTDRFGYCVRVANDCHDLNVVRYTEIYIGLRLAVKQHSRLMPVTELLHMHEQILHLRSAVQHGRS